MTVLSLNDLDPGGSQVSLFTSMLDLHLLGLSLVDLTDYGALIWL